MKKTIITCVLAALSIFGTSAFVAKYQSGIAGYTGSPVEASCGACHTGGSSSSAAVTISSVPVFTANQFVPGATYTITINISAAGFTKFGFGCEILDENYANAGTLQNAGSGVYFLTAGGRKNAVHTGPKTGNSVSFSFQWVAPSAAESASATIYAAGNAVDGSHTYYGDYPIPPVNLPLTAAETEPDPVGLNEIKASTLMNLSVYPNPASSLGTLSYMLTQSQTITIQLTDLGGKILKTVTDEKQSAGLHSQLIDLQGLAPGIYFVKLSGNGEKLAQRLLTVQ